MARRRGGIPGGYMTFRAGAWRLEVDAGKHPVTGKRAKVRETFYAPDTKAGETKAARRLAALVAEVQARTRLPSSGLTVELFLRRWVESHRPSWEKKSPGQADATLARLENHVFPLIGDTNAEALGPLAITDLYNRWRAGRPPSKRCTCRASRTDECRGHVPLGEASVRRQHDILSAAWAWAMRMELLGIARNPFERIDKPEKPRPKPKAPAPALIADMIAMANAGLPVRGRGGKVWLRSYADLALYLRIGAIAGARRGQLCGLRWNRVTLPDVDDPEAFGSVLWDSALAVVKGGVADKGTKTDLEWRISIDPHTVRLLRAHHRAARERALSVGRPLAPDAYVFARDALGQLPWHPDGASQRFAKLRTSYAEAHPDVDVSWVQAKDVRNYMATELLGGGHDPTVVAQRGGWSNNTTPLNTYAAFRPARDQAAAQALAAGLDGT